jgi:hypothetical protein
MGSRAAPMRSRGPRFTPAEQVGPNDYAVNTKFCLYLQGHFCGELALAVLKHSHHLT